MLRTGPYLYLRTVEIGAVLDRRAKPGAAQNRNLADIQLELRQRDPDQRGSIRMADHGDVIRRHPTGPKIGHERSQTASSGGRPVLTGHEWGLGDIPVGWVVIQEVDDGDIWVGVAQAVD